MVKRDQIKILKTFLNSSSSNLLINDINDEITTLYFSLIKFFTKENNIKISIKDNLYNNDTNKDLFGFNEINIFKSKNKKKILEIIDYPDKKIIICDYKNFKNLSTETDSINCYLYDQDIKNFIYDELKIKNRDLLNFCINNPTLLFSETSKYLLNSDNYIKDQKLYEEKNHILEIRKSIFSVKKNIYNVQDLYSKIKKEARYKKLNFLTY